MDVGNGLILQDDLVEAAVDEGFHGGHFVFDRYLVLGLFSSIDTDFGGFCLLMLARVVRGFSFKCLIMY